MQEQSRDPLIEEVLRWLVVLKDRAASDADRAAFEDWLRADPRHQAAWLRAQSVWMRVGKVGPAFAGRRQPRPVGVPPPRCRPRRLPCGGRRKPLHTEPPSFSLRRGGRRCGCRAGGSAVVAAGSSCRPQHGGRRTPQGHARGRLDRRACRLVVAVGRFFRRSAPGGAARWRGVLRRRARGTRPFVVQGRRTVPARPSARSFDVKRQGTEVTVAVVEHAVAVSSAGGRVVVEQGQQIRYGTRLVSARWAKPTSPRSRCWRRHRLIFQETPLGEGHRRPGTLSRRPHRHDRRPPARHPELLPCSTKAGRRRPRHDRERALLRIRLRRVTGLLVVLSPNA